GVAFGKERLARSDRTAEEITHRRRLELALSDPSSVLLQPRFRLRLPHEQVKLVRRLNELDQPLTLPLDHSFFQLAELAQVQRAAAALRQKNIQIDEVQSGRRLRESFDARRPELAARVFADDGGNEFPPLWCGGKRNFDRRDVRTVDEPFAQ